MPLLSDEAMVQTAEQRASFRLTNVSSKLSRSETERFDALAKRRGQQRGELIRRLILDELTRDGGEPAASAELSEIVGLRLMLTNVLKPLATGQKLTPEVFDGIMTEVKKRKKAVAIEARQEAERA
ncbi:MAG: ribbon-helix-helix domain-containing protein [Candidatus Pacebacteria bacterium]|nr:ribbon-helix-helix domain-containing protein [Candidatus Paceibacterota bacterium]